MADRLASAYEALRQGRFVLIYDADGREEEVDLFVAGEHATPAAVRALRRDAGGLVFLAVDPRVGQAFRLPFLQDLYAEAAKQHPVLGKLVPDDIKYDTRSSFSLTLNHRTTFTGITDDDRSTTITELTRLAAQAAATPERDWSGPLGAAFRAPGHVHLCVGASGLLADRQGHTELAAALARMAGTAPIVAGAEMLGEGGALPLADARAWADANGAVLIEGHAIQDAWRAFEAARPREA